MSENKFVHFFNSLSEDMKVKAKELFTTIKTEKFEDEQKPAASFVEVPLQDGTILKVGGELVAGTEVILITPEGEIPAPEGDLILADGSTIVVKKDGEKSVIAEVKPAEEMKKDTKDAPVNMEAIEKAISDKFDAKFSALEKENKSLKAEHEALKLKVSQKAAQLKSTVELFEALSNVETAEPIKTPTKKIEKVDALCSKIFTKK